MKSNKNLGDYISIPIHAREIYDLKGNDLLVYGLIHGFSRDGVNWYTNGQQYICDWIGVTDTKSVRRIIDRLIEIGAIEKQEVWQNNVRFVNYRAICPDRGQNAPTPGVKMPYNNIIDNIPPNNPTLFDNKDSIISPQGDSSKKTIDDRRSDFHESLRPYIQTYGEDMIIAFYNYWVEKNPKGTKMRFEMEKTFELSRRLATWRRNEEERKFRRR